MRVAATVCALVLLGACATTSPRESSAAHWAALPVLGALQVPILYHQAAATPLPADQLISWYGDVCGERDAGSKPAAEAAARASLARAVAEAGRATRWLVPLRQTLGSYDPQRGGFATSLRTGGVVRFDPSDYCKQPLTYLLAFENGSDFSVLHLSEERAKQFVRANLTRTVVHELEVEVSRVQAGPPSPTVLVRIVRLRAKDAVNGAVLADTGVDPR
jgi:hypothetical protein